MEEWNGGLVDVKDFVRTEGGVIGAENSGEDHGYGDNFFYFALPQEKVNFVDDPALNIMSAASITSVGGRVLHQPCLRWGSLCCGSPFSVGG